MRNPKINSPEPHYSSEEEETPQTWAQGVVREGFLEEVMPVLKFKFQLGKQRDGGRAGL